MIEISNKSGTIVLKDSNKKEIAYNTDSLNVTVDWFDVSYPWEYEKSEILLEVKEFEEKLFYKFLIETKHVVIISYDSFELKEEILSFFWDVDILIIIWTRESAKIFESIEAKLVVPYWSWKDVFLNTLGQHIEEVANYKIKSELDVDRTEFVNLVWG